MTYRDYESPQRYSSWRLQGFLGCLAVSPRRVIGFGRATKVADIPLDHPHLDRVRLSVEPSGALCVAIEASDFFPERKGTVECRFYTPRAAELLLPIRQEAAAHEPPPG